MTDWFVAIDLETANQNRHSICQLGLAAFEDQSELWTWGQVVNPEENFDSLNVRIHGIGSMDVHTAPKFPEVLAAIAPSLDGQLLVSHTSFDREAMEAALSRYGLATPNCAWLDTCAIARQAWPHLENHKLGTLAKYFGIQFRHHDAVQDASVCGRVLLKAIAETQIPLSHWYVRAQESSKIAPAPGYRQAARRHYPEKIEIKGRDNAPLSGHVVVLTGEFSIGELRLAQIAADVGCDVEKRFRKKHTSILVVGKRDPERFNGKEKSNKQLSAEAAIADGYNIAIMDEAGFLDLASQCVPA